MIEDLIDKGIQRNILVYDGDAIPGLMTKRLLALVSTVMRRNSFKRQGKLTDVLISPEGFADLDAEKNKGYINRFNYHIIDALGVDCPLNNFFLKTRNGYLPTGDLEFGIALDLNGSFESLLTNNLSMENVLLFSY